MLSGEHQSPPPQGRQPVANQPQSTCPLPSSTAQAQQQAEVLDATLPELPLSVRASLPVSFGVGVSERPTPSSSADAAAPFASPQSQPAFISRGDGSWHFASPATSAQLAADVSAALSTTPIVWGNTNAPALALFPTSGAPCQSQAPVAEQPPAALSPVAPSVAVLQPASVLPSAAPPIAATISTMPAPPLASFGHTAFPFSSLPTRPRPGNGGKHTHAAAPLTPVINPFLNPFTNPFMTPPPAHSFTSQPTPRSEQARSFAPSALFSGPQRGAEGSRDLSFLDGGPAFSKSDESSGSFSSASSLLAPSVSSTRATPVTRPLPSSPSSMMLRARGIRQVYSEGPSRRDDGGRIIAPDGTDAEFSAPLSLALDIDQHLQSRMLEACSASDPPARSGVPEDAFEAAWESSALELSEVVATAVGCTLEEASESIARSNGDCSIALLSMLHDRGDPFQQQCAHASVVELRRRRQERSLSVIVEDAAKQGRIPPDISSKRMIRSLRQHLPLNEIMGHRYRTPVKPKRSSNRPRVSFEEEGGDRIEDEEGDDSGSDGGRSASSQHSRFGASDDDASSYEGDDDDDDSAASMDSPDSDESDESEDKAPSHRQKKKKRKSNLMAVPPPNWTDGDPPEGGYYLETFTRIYQSYRSFTALHGKSLTFKSLIQFDIEPTVMMELRIKKVEVYQLMSDEQLLKRIKKSLGFQEEDYYARKLELLRFPPCDQSKPSALYRSFRKLTTPFLKILREAEDSGARLRKANVSRIFKNQIRGFPALERWFLSKRFKTFNDAVQHISREIHSRLSKEVESHHDELIVSGQVSGARTDIRGGKAEPGRARGANGGFQNQNRNPKGQHNDARNKRRRTDDRDSQHQRGNQRFPTRSPQEEDAFRKALDKEKALPQGMFHHPRGPFCRENPCRAKICQGCNYHAGPDGQGHIRPNCRCKNHPEFVAEGYFHDKHPGRSGALTLPKSPKLAGADARFGPPPTTAKVRYVAGRVGKSSDQ